MKPLHIISYLSPSIPADFFRVIASDLEATLEFNEAISGPLAGDDEPFSDGRADVGFVCSPTYRWLQRKVELLPLPVPIDPIANGRPLYYGQVIVRANSSIKTFEDLRGRTWAFNDRNSRSGWLWMLERAGAEFFSRHIHSGSHLRSIDLVRSGAADAASIDSNVLLRQDAGDLRVLESWGPFAIQPAIVRVGLESSAKNRVAHALLTLHQRQALEPFGFTRFVPPDESLYA